MDVDTILRGISILLVILIVACGALIAVLNHWLEVIATNLRRIEYEVDGIAVRTTGKLTTISRLNEYFEAHHYSEFERKEILDYISKGD